MIKTEFNPNTGEIGFVWSSPDDAVFELNKNNTRDFLEGEYDGKKQYFDISLDYPEVKQRPTFTPIADKQKIKADGTDVITINGLPNGITQCKIIGPIMVTYNEESSKATLTVNLVGSYKIRFSHWPYQDAEVEFDAY